MAEPIAGIEPLLTVEQVAELLGVDRQAIYDSRCAGEAPGSLGITIGKRRIRFEPAVIRAYLAEQGATAVAI